MVIGDPIELKNGAQKQIKPGGKIKLQNALFYAETVNKQVSPNKARKGVPVYGHILSLTFFLVDILQRDSLVHPISEG